MAVTIKDVVKLQLDYFFNRPELLAEGLMFADKASTKAILCEAGKRGINMAPHIANAFERQSRFMELLKTR